ncbi:DUF4426 domain-containing protein [Phytohalomonas tamaricis]|uniref:DUF4426 domain-containing protein n=1 Tax=Phytohalomonas tamaricis TaxID=2081032 RepID=UPI001319C639|nr:DUF4426 domain-containing protein [Phytohalomonas tamaricis]
MPAYAENTDLGDGYQAYYQAMTTHALDADDARELNIIRSRNTALITISVRRNDNNGAYCTPEADINGTVTPEGGEAKPLLFETVRMKGNVYQLSTFTFRENMPMHVQIMVRPTAERQPTAIEFTQRFNVN